MKCTVSWWGGFSSFHDRKAKHNSGMASLLTASVRFGSAGVKFIGSSPSSGPARKTLPNTSVEPTKCSKLHFAAHLER